MAVPAMALACSRQGMLRVSLSATRHTMTTSVASNTPIAAWNHTTAAMGGRVGWPWLAAPVSAAHQPSAMLCTSLSTSSGPTTSPVSQIATPTTLAAAASLTTTRSAASVQATTTTSVAATSAASVPTTRPMITTGPASKTNTPGARRWFAAAGARQCDVTANDQGRCGRGVAALLAGAAAFLAGAVAATVSSSPAECESRRVGGSSRHDVCKMVLQRDYSMLEASLRAGADPNERHRLGWAPLHVAAVNGDTHALQLLLEHGADVDIQDHYGYDQKRPSHLFARAMNFSLEVPIDPMADTAGFTALHYAVIAGRSHALQLLQTHGADPLIKDDEGRTALDLTTDDHTLLSLQEYAKQFEARQQELEMRKALEARRARRLFPLEKRLKQYIVGQESALNHVAAAVRRKENGWHDEDRPLVFLFLGSSGLGKTEVAKRLAEYTNEKDPKAFIRFDMSEYQTKHESAKLIGSPPGYVGFEDGGQLTKQLAKKPNAVVLFDEVEKSHPDVLTVLLQLFDEGRLTDGQGNTVSCKEAIFVMTSNLASDEIAEYAQAVRRDQGTDEVVFSKSFKEDVVHPILKGSFQRNEFIGRIKEIVFFTPFSASELRQLVDMQLTKWARRATERHTIELSWDEEVLDVIAREYQVWYGARSLQHAVDRLVVNQLALLFEEEKLIGGGKAHVTAKNGDVHIECTPPSSTHPQGKGSWLKGWV
eukprot:m.393561 g.393561  ORF g.393561 m.393561 type:complete len:709 (+) comp20091_c0_seq27:1658-3784(+)